MAKSKEKFYSHNNLKKILYQKPDISDLLFTIKQKLKLDQLKLFEEGAAFYKVATTDRSFIRGVLSLYVDTITRTIRTSNVDDTIKASVISNFENTTNLIAQLFDCQQILLNSISKDKKIIDAEEISYIMLGYAIETIRKIYLTKT